MSSYPLHALQALLRPTPARRGVIVSRSGSLVQVATASGIVSAQAPLALSIGQTVYVRDGLAFPVPTVGRRYPM
jgi:hypothetical protein